MSSLTAALRSWSAAATHESGLRFRHRTDAFWRYGKRPVRAMFGWSTILDPMIRTEIDCHAVKRHFNDSVIRECVGAWENHLHKKYSFSNWSTPDCVALPDNCF